MLMKMFYRAFIESVISFNMVTWFGNLSLKNSKPLSQIVKWAGRIIREPQLSLEELYKRQQHRLTGSILGDRSHPLYGEFQLLPLGRRYRLPVGDNNRFRFSFVPAAMSELNK